MVHLFQLHGDRLAFDTESQALHKLDEIAWSVLQIYVSLNGKRPHGAVMDQLFAQWGPEVAECIDEIDQLISEGSLFAEPEPVTFDQLYPDGPKIKSMCLHLCHDCNLRCQYCFAGTGDFGTGRRPWLDLKTGRQAVDFLIRASGHRHHLDIDFFGGEPLLNWPVVVDLTHYCEDRAKETGKDIRLTITTNATRLDDEKTSFINQHFKNCVLSIDGRPEIHDRMRKDAGGKGTYEEVSRRIRSFVAARGNREHYLRATFTRFNLDFDADVRHLATLSDQISVEPVVAPHGSGYEIRKEDLPIIEAAYERLAWDLYEAQKQGRGFNFFHFMIDLDEGPCLFKRVKGCGVGTEYCAVTPDGDIYPCHQFVGIEPFRMGHVSDDPAQLDQKVKKSFEKLLMPDKTACRNCWARYFCSGGCAANAWFSTGRIDGLYEIGCRMEQKRLECALWLHAMKADLNC